MTFSVVTLPGDGIGPEVTAQATRVLQAVSERFDLGVEIQESLIGGAALDTVGSPLPDQTLERCVSREECDAKRQRDVVSTRPSEHPSAIPTLGQVVKQLIHGRRYSQTPAQDLRHFT